MKRGWKTTSVGSMLTVSNEVLTAFISILPGILWVALAITLVVLLYKPVKRDLLPRIGGVQAFGVELTFLKEGLERISSDPRRALSPAQVDQVSRRAYRSTIVLQGAKVLWIDDHPINNNYERRFLNSVGVIVDIATNSSEAQRMRSLNGSDYDLVISDIERDGNSKAGIEYLSVVRAQKGMTPFIFYTGYVDADRGVPFGGFGITDMPDELLNMTMDVLERKRG